MCSIPKRRSVLLFHWKVSAIEKSHQVKRDVEMSPNGKKGLCCGNSMQLHTHTHTNANTKMQKYKTTNWEISSSETGCRNVAQWKKCLCCGNFPPSAQIQMVKAKYSLEHVYSKSAWPWEVINGFANLTDCKPLSRDLHSIHNCNSLPA